MKLVFKYALITIISLTLIIVSYCKTPYNAYTIAFYNTENLFDTIDSADKINGFLSYENPNYITSIPLDSIQDTTLIQKDYILKNFRDQISYVNSIDLDFTPNGSKKFTSYKFNEKINNLALAIKNIGYNETKNAPIILGLCEIENKSVIESLINHPILKPFNYKYIHYNSLDRRGIDVALIYQEKFFTPIDEKNYRTYQKKNDHKKEYKIRTRDQLWVYGLLNQTPIHLIINHWPSRLGGEKQSCKKRINASENTLKIIDDILKIYHNPNIIIMGDFNDNPENKSIKNLIQTSKKKYHLTLENLMNPFNKKHIGTINHKNIWFLFDQIIISNSLKKNENTLFAYKTKISDLDFLKIEKGSQQGKPKRYHYQSNYNQKGFSDHFPIYTIFIEKNKTYKMDSL